LTGTYSDVGTHDTHTLTINWGEGTPQTVPVSGGSFDITHQYLDDNPTNTSADVYSIGVTLTDDDTGTDTATTTATVSNVPPKLRNVSVTPVKVKRQEPVEVDILDPKVVAQAVVDASGQAVAIVDLIKYAGQTVYVQAFEQKPVRQVSNLMTIVVPPLPELSIDDVVVDENGG